MSNEITIVNAEKISKYTGYQPEEVAIIKQTVAKGTTDAELAYFLSVSKSAGLNPFNKEVWCYKDNKGNLLVFTGRDGFLAKAQSNTAFNGVRSSEVCENDEFEIDIANNKIKHTFGKGDRGKILGAYAIAFRKDGEPTIEYADIKDYDKKQFTWNTHKSAMIKKVAETNALKKGFGISGIQSEYDYDVKDNVVVPIDLKEVDDLTSLKRRYIELIDKQDPDFQTILRNEIKHIEEEGKLTAEVLTGLIGKLK